MTSAAAGRIRIGSDNIDLCGGKLTHFDLNIEPDVPLFRQLEVLREDLLQISFGNIVLDVGWYPEFSKNGQFRILLVRDHDWDHPSLCVNAADVPSLIETVRRFIDMAVKSS